MAAFGPRQTGPSNLASFRQSLEIREDHMRLQCSESTLVNLEKVTTAPEHSRNLKDGCRLFCRILQNHGAFLWRY